jgi:Flp pilus assembly protein TadG
MIASARIRGLVASRRGAAAVVFALATPMLIGATGFAVDGGLMYIAQSRLQTAADAAALAGAKELEDNAGGAATRAIALATSNSPANAGNTLVAQDIVTGTWDPASRTFTPGGANPDAIQVTTRHAAANGNPHNLIFGGFLGLNSMDLSATAVAYAECEGPVLLFPIPNTFPTQTSIVTMGQANGFLQTPDKHPIVRIDNHIDGPRTIQPVVLAGPGGSQTLTQAFTVPGRGQFYAVVTTFTNDPATYPAGTVNITWRQPARSGTATWNNRIREERTLVGKWDCVGGPVAAKTILVNPVAPVSG